MTNLTPLELALAYASDGMPVFPCRAAPDDVVDQHTGEIETKEAKTPLTSNGLKGATRYERNIRRLWQDNPDALIGVPTGAPSGFWVLDIDVPPDHADGREWLAEMEGLHGPLPATRSATTASGGTHYFWRHHHGVRNKAGKAIAAGVDTRGDGGYVAMPGSQLADGRAYAWDNDNEILPAPAWLLELVLPKIIQHVASPMSYAAGTNDAYVNKAVDDELHGLAGASPGGRGHALNRAAFSLGQLVGAGALSRGEAEDGLYAAATANGVLAKDGQREVMAKIKRGLDAGVSQPRDIPQLQTDNTKLVDISRMIANGLAKGKSKATAMSPAEDNGEETEPDLPVSEPEEPAGPITATAFKWIDPRTLPRREFAFGTHYIRKYVSVTVSPGGLGKTSNSIMEALAMTSGRALAGTKSPQRLNVWLFNAEDPRDEMERRIMAACLHFNLKPEDIEGRLFLDTGREQELVVAVEDKRVGVKIQVPIVESIVEQIERHKIDVMIIDPFVSTHQVNENDNGAIDRVAKLWAQIADHTNCAVDVVHHLRKVADREATVEDARGAVSLIGAARSVRVLNRMTEEQANRAGISASDRFSYFWIHQGKANLSKVDDAEHWRKMESVPLGNGVGTGKAFDKPQDYAGVVTEWKWPSKEEMAAVVPEDVRRGVLIKLENQNYRESDQSQDWAGYVIAPALDIHLETTKAMTSDKKKVKSILDAWIAAGIVAVVDEPDPKHLGRTIKYVRPASPTTSKQAA